MQRLGAGGNKNKSLHLCRHLRRAGWRVVLVEAAKCADLRAASWLLLGFHVFRASPEVLMHGAGTGAAARACPGACQRSTLCLFPQTTRWGIWRCEAC